MAALCLCIRTRKAMQTTILQTRFTGLDWQKTYRWKYWHRFISFDDGNDEVLLVTSVSVVTSILLSWHVSTCEITYVMILDVVCNKQPVLWWFVGLETNPNRPNSKLPYRGAWLNVGSEMIHLMELPNPDPTTGRPEQGAEDRHVCVFVKDLKPLKALFDKTGELIKIRRGQRKSSLGCKAMLWLLAISMWQQSWRDGQLNCRINFLSVSLHLWIT